MKRRFLSLVILTVAIVSFGFGTYRSLAQNDPACIEACRQKYLACRAAAQDQGAERNCIADFRACKAQCPGPNNDIQSASAKCAVP